MKKSELKALLKPMIKECIKECILEEGVLSGIITEVAKGLSSSTITENKRHKRVTTQKKAIPEQTTLGKSAKEQLAEHKSMLMNAIGVDAYGGIDLFEGTTPVPGQKSPEAQANDPLGGVAPNDAGIDISGIMAIGGNKWKSLIG
jgi:hypothetical protein